MQSGTVTLNDGTSPQFTNYHGLTNNYETFTFNVPAGQARLDASIAYPGNPAKGNNQRVRLILIDPTGSSLPTRCRRASVTTAPSTCSTRPAAPGLV